MTNEAVSLIPREIREAGFREARFLNEAEQTKYNEAIKSFGEKARKSLDISLKGSNLFKVLFLNQIGIPTATIPDLETALENGMNLEGTYEDGCEVILRSAGDSNKSNDYLARDLAKKLKIKRLNGASHVITGLGVKEDNNSAYGLIFDVTDKTKIIRARDLDHENNEKRFSRINPDYSIEFTKDGNRMLYTRPNGVSRFCLDRDLSLVSGCDGLADSDDDGRVVVVSGDKASQKNLEQYITPLNQKKTNLIAEIEKKYARAMKILTQ